MYTYIKRNVKKVYVVLEEQLNPENYNNLGYDYADFLDNKWVLLSEEQAAFHEEHPEASVKEVLDMELIERPVEPREYIRTIEEAKREMKRNIDRYHLNEIHQFTINGDETWFDFNQRTEYRQNIESARRLGYDTTQFYVDDNIYTVNIDEFEKCLDRIQVYNNECDIIAKNHELTVDSLETIEEVDNYDYMAGYPERLNFNIE